MKRALAPMLLLFALCAPAARAQPGDDIWVDPTLDAAVKDADLIILGECTFVAQGGGAAYKITKTFKGTPPEGGKAIVVIGLLSPDQPRDATSVEVGDKAYLLLRGSSADGGMSVPTPTFGRFPIIAFGEQPVVVGTFSDTFVRVPVPPARWERILEALVEGEADDALMADVRGLLAAKGSDPNDVYVALEVLALFGEEADRAAVTALLADPRFTEPRRYRVRIAAASVLGRLGGPQSVERLLALVEKDEVDAVKSAAAAALGPALERLQANDAATVTRATEKLAALALHAPAESIRPGSAHDRRDNQQDGVLGAILRTLGTVRARAGIAPALKALERQDDGDALVAGLTFFSALGEPEQAGAIAARMRRPGAKDEYFNPLFVRTLEALTGQRFGDDREAWVGWARERGLLPQGPEGPPAPPGEGRDERR